MADLSQSAEVSSGSSSESSQEQAPEKPQVSLERLCKEFLEGKAANNDDVSITRVYPPKFDRTKGNDSRFKPLDLAIGSLDIFNGKSRDALTENQRESLDSIFEQWVNKSNVRNGGKKKSKQIPTHPQGFKVLTLIYDFSRVFLLGGLDKVKFMWNNDLEDQPSVYGDTAHDDNGWCAIRIKPGDWADRMGVLDRETAFLGALFHECIHAYLAIYCCNNKAHGESLVTTDADFDCRRDNDPSWNAGSSCHSVAWFHLASAVELGLERLLSLKIRVGVFSALLREYDTSAPRYTAGEWQRYFDLFRWKGVNTLVSGMNESELQRFAAYLVLDEHVVGVFMRENLVEKDRIAEELRKSSERQVIREQQLEKLREKSKEAESLPPPSKKLKRV